MNRIKPLPAVLAAALALIGPAVAGIAVAQTPAAQAPAARRAPPPDWERLSPAQREAVVAVLRDRWDSNPGQRARMLEHAERWQRMTPEQRREARHGQRRWEQMSPQERTQARAAFEHGRDLPPGKRDALRERLKGMTPEQRQEWLRTHRGPREPRP